MAASTRPKATTSRTEPAGSRSTGRGATRSSTTAAVATRTSAVPAGPSAGNSPLATAAPSCTETTPPSTMSTGTACDSAAGWDAGPPVGDGVGGTDAQPAKVVP